MTLLPILVASLASVPAPSGVLVYIGVYTSENGSRGIYSSRLNEASGELSPVLLAVETPNPSYLAVNTSKRMVYAVNEASGGEIHVFRINNERLERVQTLHGGGGGPCHISVDARGRSVFVSAYGGGSIAAFPIQIDGTLGERAAFFQNTGKGPNAARQQAPHMHFASTDPLGRHLYACDLGTDEVLILPLAESTGMPDAANRQSVKVPAGGGPRHLVVHPSQPYLFVNNELTMTVSTFGRDLATGSLELVDTAPLLPADTPSEGLSTAAIKLHPNGRFLYVSNRGHNSITVFRIASAGKLERIQVHPAGVTTPRGMAVSPAGMWLLVAGQDSNDVVTHKIDAESGLLSPAKARIEVSTPVCLAFSP